MPISDDVALRGFLARLLGWKDERVIDNALRSVDLAVNHDAQLVLCGPGDLVPIAQALHRRTLGADRPFVVCDRHRGDTPASARGPANRTTGVAAFEAAIGGTLCLRARRLPRDYWKLVAQLRDTRDVTLMVCAGPSAALDPLIIWPPPLTLPALALRADEIDRVIAEYAAEACAELCVPPRSFTGSDHVWVREYAATSLDEIEKATLRLTAIRVFGTMSAAAVRLGMALPSLYRWMDDRKFDEGRR